MSAEQGIWIVFAIAIFFAAKGSLLVWRILGLKLAIDTAAVALLAFDGKSPLGGIRILSLLVLIVGTSFLFSALVFAFQFFRARRNE